MRCLRLRPANSLRALPRWALSALLAGALVTTTLRPPEGCRIERADVRHTMEAEPTIMVKLESLCPMANGQALRCTSEWRENKDGRHKVDVVCQPIMLYEYP